MKEGVSQAVRSGWDGLPGRLRGASSLNPSLSCRRPAARREPDADHTDVGSISFFVKRFIKRAAKAGDRQLSPEGLRMHSMSFGTFRMAFFIFQSIQIQKEIEK